MAFWRGWLAILVMVLVPGGLRADDGAGQMLGFGRLFSNDAIGDGHDRWRTGSSFWSLVVGPSWSGAPPPRPGALLEYRLRTEIIAPRRIDGGRADRPYVGALSFGLHSHMRRGAVDLVAGADLVLVGPQTGLADLQTRFHDRFGLRPPTGTGDQIADALHLVLAAEAALPVALSRDAALRPFAELRAGDERLVRLGADLLVGPGAGDGLFTRDPVTGQLVRIIGRRDPGVLGVVGLDVASVGASYALPAAQGYLPPDSQWRARTGLHWRITPRLAVFYGLTWLSPEFAGQPEGQLLGGLRLDFNF